jgi:phospholipid/cholesterol/gamma-HCH transport system ATP-binding protein
MSSTTSKASDLALRFEDVTVGFDSEPALQNVSFELGVGETGIILGTAGAGKTVLLKTAMALLKPWSGKVFLFGQDITNFTEKQLFDARGKMGMLFQESALFDSLTIEQNVAYPLLNQNAVKCPPNEVRARVQEALDFVELGQTLKRFPSELSGGMRRRAAIARAVVTKPPLLLYDSPTAGLDPITASTIMTLIIKERDLDNTSALVVTYRYQDGNLVANFRYNPDDGKLASTKETERKRTKFIVMKEGKLIFDGNQQELESQQDSYISKFVKKPN